MSRYPLDQQLEDAAANVRRLADDLERETDRRDRLVRRALQRDDWTHARVAEVTGLTRARVGQIALAKR